MAEYINKSDVIGLVRLGLSGDVIVTAIINDGISSVPAIPIPEDSEMGKYLRETMKMLQESPCEDAVSRQDCINAIENTDCELSPQAWKEITNNIVSLLPVTPTPKKGKWIEVDTNMYTCSNCSHCFTIVPEDNQIQEFKCCPCCKTEMEGEE